MSDDKQINTAAILEHILSAIECAKEGKPEKVIYMLELIIPDVARAAFLDAKVGTEFYEHALEIMYQYRGKQR